MPPPPLHHKFNTGLNSLGITGCYPLVSNTNRAADREGPSLFERGLEYHHFSVVMAPLTLPPSFYHLI